ncbi:TPA: hypothetical protein HA246_05490 [Candidatus Woesearchaeota archaeon]|nr:hypothetical protein [Candidatus Woesearchaeota archaeon]
MKRLLKTIILGIFLALALVTTVNALTFSAIPSQTHIQNTTEDKLIVLSNFATNDTTGYTLDCNATEIVGSLVGSGHLTNFSFHPAVSFVGTSVCNITASNGTDSASQLVSIAVAAHNADVSLSTASNLLWLKNLSSSISNSFIVTNNGNVALSVNLQVENFVDAANVSNTISNSVAALNTTSFALGIGESKAVSLTLSGILNLQKTANYTSKVNVTYNSSSANKTESLNLALNVRDAVTQLTLPTSLRLGTDIQSLGSNATTNLTLQNTGDTVLSNVVVSSTADVKYKILFSTNNVNFTSTQAFDAINPGEIKSFIVKGVISTDLTAGVKTDIGDLIITSPNLTGNVSITDFYVQTVSKLSVEEVEVTFTDIQNREKTESMELTGDRINDVQAGKPLRIKVKLKNDFTDAEDIEIQDIDVTVTIENIDDEDDLDEEVTDIDVNAENTESVDLNFVVPVDAEKDNYDVTIEAEGRDESTKARHKVVFKFTLEVDRKDHELEIRKMNLLDGQLSCKRNTLLDIEIANIGSKEEEEAALEVTSAELGLNYKRTDIELTNDYKEADSRARFSVPIALKDTLKAGTYPIRAKLLFSDTILDDIRDVQLVVQECNPQNQSAQQTTQTQNTQTTQTGQTQTTQSGQNAQAGQQQSGQKQPGAQAEDGKEPVFVDDENVSFKDSDYFVPVLVVSFLLGLGAVTVLVSMLIMPKH